MTFKQRLRASFKTRPRTPAASTATTPAPKQAASAAQASAAAAAPTNHSERERLAGEFAAMQSDLGGLVYEMASRDHFRLDVLSQQAAKLRLVDAELARAEGRAAPAASVGNCPSCSTPLVAGAAYCAGCGRALASQQAVVAPASPAPAAPAHSPPASATTAVTAQGTPVTQPNSSEVPAGGSR